MWKEHNFNLSMLFIRLALGGCLIMHGIGKLRHGIGGIQAMLSAKNLPEVLSYGVYAGELAAPVLLILGIFTRASAFVVLVLCAFILTLGHSDAVFALNPKTGGLNSEIVFLYIGMALALLFGGSGNFALYRD